MVGSVADWRALCQQQQHALVDSVRALLAACHDEIQATRIDTSWIDRRYLPIDRQTESAQNLVRSTWGRCRDDDRREELKLELDLALLELALVREHGVRYLRAHAAHAMMNHALNEDARTRFCGSCGATLVTMMVSQAHEVPCSHCHRVQLVEPGPAFRTFASAAARWVGEWDGFAQFAALRRQETQIDAYRDRSAVPLELLRAYHQASHQYWSTVLTIEGQLVPERQRHMPAQLEALMADTHRRLSSFWQWREQAP